MLQGGPDSPRLVSATAAWHRVGTLKMSATAAWHWVGTLKMPATATWHWIRTLKKNGSINRSGVDLMCNRE